MASHRPEAIDAEQRLREQAAVRLDAAAVVLHDDGLPEAARQISRLAAWLRMPEPFDPTATEVARALLGLSAGGP